MLFTNLNVNPPIIAHRGVSALAPENTMAAFKMAKQYELSCIELDVTIAACGTVVVFHDDTLERTTNGVGNITDFTYEYLKTLDAGSWFSTEFAGEKIPTLREVLLFLSQANMAANIEIKSYPQHEEVLVKNVLSEISQVKLNTPLLLTSFSTEIIRQVRAQGSLLPLGLILSEWNEDVSDFYKNFSLTNIGVAHNILTQDKVVLLKTFAQTLFCYTVNDPREAIELLSWGVDAIFSDCGPEMLSYVSQLSQKQL